jgi:hypothetical protein
VAAGVPAPGIEETKAIAEQAYIYAFPMIAAYKAMYEFNVDKSSPPRQGQGGELASRAGRSDLHGHAAHTSAMNGFVNIHF